MKYLANVLPPEAAFILRAAAEDQRLLRDEEKRENNYVDDAIARVRKMWPEYFRQDGEPYKGWD